MTPENDKSLTQIPAGVWVLGFVSMLMDISSEMIHSLLPLFMVSILGANGFVVGLVEGAAEAVALITKVFSGPLSDYLGKRKALTVAGYGLGAISKPLFALASGVGMVFLARFMDRIGKGLRGAPRDAWVADLSPPSMRGAAYGLRQSLDTIGAFTGPLVATGLMLLWANDFRKVFWVAFLPGTLSVVLLVVTVYETKRQTTRERINPIHMRELKRLSWAYWWVVAIGAVFTLARFSEAFLLLRAQQLGLSFAWMPFVLVVMNVVYSLSAYPFGKHSDTTSHLKLLALGLVVLILADLILANAASLWSVFLGVALWGMHMGVTQGLLATMVADSAPGELRGTAFGFFNLVGGLAMLLANAFAGLVWDRLGPSFTFDAGFLVCGIGLAVIALVPNSVRQRIAGLRSRQGQ